MNGAEADIELQNCEHNGVTNWQTDDFVLILGLLSFLFHAADVV